MPTASTSLRYIIVAATLCAGDTWTQCCVLAASCAAWCVQGSIVFQRNSLGHPPLLSMREAVAQHCAGLLHLTVKERQLQVGTCICCLPLVRQSVGPHQAQGRMGLETFFSGLCC